MLSPPVGLYGDRSSLGAQAFTWEHACLHLWDTELLRTLAVSLQYSHYLPLLHWDMGRQSTPQHFKVFTKHPKRIGDQGHIKARQSLGHCCSCQCPPLSCRWRCVCVQVLSVPRDRMQPCGQAVLHHHTGLQQRPHPVRHTPWYVFGSILEPGRWRGDQLIAFATQAWWSELSP